MIFWYLTWTARQKSFLDIIILLSPKYQKNIKISIIKLMIFYRDILINIDYYMLRAWYRFYSRVFNSILQTSKSSRIVPLKMFLQICVFLFSFSSRNWEISSSETFTNLEVAISLIKLQSNSSRQIWHQVSAKI